MKVLTLDRIPPMHQDIPQPIPKQNQEICQFPAHNEAATDLVDNDVEPQPDTHARVFRNEHRPPRINDTCLPHEANVDPDHPHYSTPLDGIGDPTPTKHGGLYSKVLQVQTWVVRGHLILV